MGAWIEISGSSSSYNLNLWSHPSWVRGLKCNFALSKVLIQKVAPLVGAWIEIKIACAIVTDGKVAPLVGAWIEIKANVFL